MRNSQPYEISSDRIRSLLEYMDPKLQIVGMVRQIEQLTEQKGELWSLAKKSLDENNVSGAITFLNRYFSIKERLDMTESSLASLLKGQFSDK
jgi:hypothetical protein